MDPIGKHTLEFVRACEAIHALLTIRTTYICRAGSHPVHQR